jgi:hypothetical protein
VQNPELVAKLEQWLNDVSAALHRLTRERDVLRKTKSQFMWVCRRPSRLRQTFHGFRKGVTATPTG